MKVKDAMEAEVTTLSLDDSLNVADDIMTLGRIRHLPVVNGAGQLVGIVSQRDLLHATVASVLRFTRKSERDWLSVIPVRDVMTTEVISIGSEASLADAADLMVVKKIGCLPVVDDGRLVGLVTESDCLRCLRGLLDDAHPAPASA